MNLIMHHAGLRVTTSNPLILGYIYKQVLQYIYIEREGRILNCVFSICNICLEGSRPMQEIMVTENEASVSKKSPLLPRLLTCYTKCFLSGSGTLRLNGSLQVASRRFVSSQTVSLAVLGNWSRALLTRTFDRFCSCVDIKMLSKPWSGVRVSKAPNCFPMAM